MIMKAVIFSAAAAGALLAGLGSFSAFQSTPAEPAFLEPRLLAAGLCGSDNTLEKRRAFFLEMGRAYAQEAAFSTENTSLPEQTLSAFALDITTSDPQAQYWFNIGLSHLANFNHGEAEEAFQRAQAFDPVCAMCFWGEAFALGSNINAPFNAEQGKKARAALNAALDRRTDITPLEDALIQALNVRYYEIPGGEVREEAEAFAAAMESLASEFPDSDFALALAAEANMDTQPWDYWEKAGLTAKGRTAKTIDLLETVLARNPDYAPAIHLYIHITEASNDPYRAERFADRLSAQQLRLGHLIHMPSHTYYRIGRWEKSLLANIDAVAVDEAYLEAGDASDVYRYGYYPHNVHFTLTTAMMAGKRDTARDMAKKLEAALPLAGDKPEPRAEWIAASNYQSALQFLSTDDIIALPEPDDAHPFLKASWHYSQGQARALMGDFEAASGHAAALEALASTSEIAAYEAAFIPAPDILQIAGLTVRARIAAEGGDLKMAIQLMEQAVIVQDGISYTEPPFWYYPARQTLAAYALRDGQHDRARALFYETLVESPNNAYALYGLSKTFEAMKDDRSADYAMSLFEDAWLGDADTTPDLERL